MSSHTLAQAILVPFLLLSPSGIAACANESGEEELVAALVDRDGLDQVQARCVVDEMQVSFGPDAIDAVTRRGMSGLPRDSWQSYVWIFSACAIGAHQPVGS